MEGSCGWSAERMSFILQTANFQSYMWMLEWSHHVIAGVGVGHTIGRTNIQNSNININTNSVSAVSNVCHNFWFRSSSQRPEIKYRVARITLKSKHCQCNICTSTEPICTSTELSLNYLSLNTCNNRTRCLRTKGHTFLNLSFIWLAKVQLSRYHDVRWCCWDEMMMST
jgi:hypothetical protein